MDPADDEEPQIRLLPKPICPVPTGTPSAQKDSWRTNAG